MAAIARDEGRRRGLSDDDHDNPADHSAQALDRRQDIL
jgi:hypothetical protein